MKTSSMSIVLLYALPLLFVSCYDSEKEKRQVKPVESRTERHETRDRSAPPESGNIRLSDGQKELCEAQALLEKAKSEKEELEQQLVAMQMELTKPAHMRQSKSSGLSLGDIIAQLEKYAALGDFKMDTKSDSHQYQLGEYYLENGNVALGMEALSKASQTHSYTIGEDLLKHYHLLQDGLETIHDFPYLYEVLRIAQKGPKSLPRDKYVQTLLDLGADIDAHDGLGDTALIYAAGHLDADIVKQLIDAGADVHAKNDEGKTAFRCAMERGSADSVRLLLAAGATGAEIQTAFETAVDHVDAEKAKLLLDAGADVNEKMSDGSNPLIYTTSRSFLFVKEADEKRTRIPSLVQVLLEGGADVNAVDKNGETALMGEMHHRRAGVIKLLLDAGANVNAKNKEGDTALGIYWRQKYWNAEDADVLKLLLDAGADLSTLSYESGETALMQAISDYKPVEVIQVMVKSGVNIDAKEKWYGKTALMMAAAKGRASVVKILLDAGAKVNVKDKEGRSALDYFPVNGFGLSKAEIETAKILEKAGAKRFSKGR